MASSTLPTWIDLIAARWDIDNQKGGTVNSYRAYEKNGWPESLPPDVYPAALTYPTTCTPMLEAGAQYLLWSGRTEFHLAPGIQKYHLPFVNLFFAPIVTAAAGDITLGGAVSWFKLNNEAGPGLTLGELTYGTENPHWGILAEWRVKEMISVTVA